MNIWHVMPFLPCCLDECHIWHKKKLPRDSANQWKNVIYFLSIWNGLFNIHQRLFSSSLLSFSKKAHKEVERLSARCFVKYISHCYRAEETPRVFRKSLVFVEAWNYIEKQKWLKSLQCRKKSAIKLEHDMYSPQSLEIWASIWNPKLIP